MPIDSTPPRPAARPWLWAVVALAGGQGCSGEVASGRELFFGHRPLSGHIAGQDWELPQDTVACTNCHESRPSSAPSPIGQVGGALAFGPPLTRTTLTRALGRRGGPPSVYDRARLCRAVREGIDPAWVVIPQAMPRYAFSDEECGALWAFLLTRS